MKKELKNNFSVTFNKIQYPDYIIEWMLSRVYTQYMKNLLLNEKLYVYYGLWKM